MNYVEKGRIGRAEPLAENPIRNCKEDDEENASRMLSSRSDLNGTGFSSNGKDSTPQSTNGPSFF